MANINAFYPQRLKGWALGLNAGGGNLGVAAVQLVGLVVLATAGVGHPRLVAGVYIPLIVLAALGAALYMDNLTPAAQRDGGRCARSPGPAHLDHVVPLHRHVRLVHRVRLRLRAGAADPVRDRFPTPVEAAYLTFLGPLIGSLVRPVGGWLADRVGGARVTFWNFVAMAARRASSCWLASGQQSLPLFLIGFVVAVRLQRHRQRLDVQDDPGDLPREGTAMTRRAGMAGALIGIAGAVGAFGGVLVNIAFRQSFLAYGTGDARVRRLHRFYALCCAVTWAVYLRRSPSRLPGV